MRIALVPSVSHLQCFKSRRWDWPQVWSSPPQRLWYTTLNSREVGAVSVYYKQSKLEARKV